MATSLIYWLKNGRIPVGSDTWVWEVNKEKQTDRDSLTLPLETKAFAGLRANTQQGTVAREHVVALTGLSATASRGALYGEVEIYDYLDTFTDTNGTLLTAHFPDISVWGTWTTVYDPSASGEPTIQTNRLRGAAAAYCASNSEGYPSIDPWYLRADVFRRNTTGSSSEVNGIAFCTTSSGNSGGFETFVFGWNEASDQWQLDRYWSGAYNSTVATSTTGAFTGSSQTRRIEVRVTGTGGFGPNLNIECWVDGVSVITHNETVFAYDFNSWGVFFGGDSSVDIDFLGSLSDVLRLSGHRLNTAQGTLIPGNIELVGFQLIANYGIFSFGGTPASVALTGQALTTAAGSAKGWISVGSEGVTSDILPNVAIHTNYNDTFYPGIIRNHFLPYKGTYYATGEILTDQERIGHLKVDQDQLLPWTDNGLGVSGLNDLSTFMNNNAVNGISFPRLGLALSPTWEYNDGSWLAGGYFTLGADGVTFSAHVRAFRQLRWESYGVTGDGSLFSSDDVYLAPQFGTLEGVDYSGPELRIGRYNRYDPRRSTQMRPMGVFATGPEEALAFYPRVYDSTVTGVEVELVGLRALYKAGTLTRSATGDAARETTGKRLTTAAGEIRGVLDASTVKEGRLTGLTATATFDAPTPDKTTTNVVPAFRRLKDDEWSAEVLVSSFTGASRLWVIDDGMTVARSGVGDIVHVVYASGRPVPLSSEGEQTYDVQHIGVLTLDASTMTVVSNTLTAVNSNQELFGRYISGFANIGVAHGPTRSEALVTQLPSGTYVTQFLLHGFIVHLSWTHASPTTATLTIKDPPASLPPSTTLNDLGAGWDSLERRADRVYHVLYYLGSNGDKTVITYNDATGTGSTWTNITPTSTGGSNEAGASSGNSDWDTYAGYGEGKTFLYATRWFDGVFSDTVEENQTRWVDFWLNQPAFFSLPLTTRIGRVQIGVFPNVQLTGLRAETRTDSVGLFPLVGGSKVGRLVGRSATTDFGLLRPPYLPFLIDNFGGVSGDGVTTRPSDTGATWRKLFTTDYILNGNVEALYTTTGSNILIAAEVDPPSQNYVVKGRYRVRLSRPSQWQDRANEMVGARVLMHGSGSGYFFGWSEWESQWILSKTTTMDGYVELARSSAAFTYNDFAIEVEGDTPCRLRCYVDDQLVIDTYDSSGAQLPHGYPAMRSDNFELYSLSWEYINAGTWEPTKLILTGQAATTAQGVFFFGIEGLRATTAQGVLTPDLTIYVALTGQAATTAQGAFYWFPTGLAATTAQGVITPSVVTPGAETLAGLTHHRLMTYIGTITIPIVELPGLSITLAQGAFGFVIDEVETPTGLAITGAQGLLTPVNEKGISGLPATAAGGLIVPEVAPYVSFRGQVATLAQGQLSCFAEDIVSLVGNAATTAQGVLARAADDTSALSGQSATATAGSLKPAVETPLGGVGAACSAGVVSPTVLVVFPVTGQPATVAQGAVGVYTSVELGGFGLTATQGTISVVYGGSVSPDGLAMTLRIGDVTDGFPKPKAGTLLWAKKAVDDLFVMAEPEDGPVLVEPRG